MSYYEFDPYGMEAGQFEYGEGDEEGGEEGEYGGYYEGDEDEGGYGFDIGDDYGAGKEDEGEQLDFGAAAAGGFERAHLGRTQHVGARGKQGEFLDPKDNAIAKFQTALSECFQDEKIIDREVNRISELKELLDLNMDLLASAVCFHLIHRGEISKRNVTSFLSDKSRNLEPVDTIRYIRYVEGIRANLQ